MICKNGNLINLTKRMISVILLFACLLPMTACRKEADISVRPLFYKVSDGNSSVYILGTIHVGSMKIYPLPDGIMSAYGECDTVMFEVDFNTEHYAHEIPYEETKEILGEDVIENAVAAIKAEYPNIKNRARKVFPTIDMTNINQAGYYTLQGMLSLAATAKAGLSEECGVDQAFLSYAIRDKKSIIGAESWEEQYKLAYELPPEAYREILNEYIDVDKMAETLKTEFNMWCAGNSAELELSQLGPLRGADEDLSLHIRYENFLVRNERMTDKIVSQLNADETTFALLGVTHLIGEEGIISRLKEMGYSIELVSAGGEYGER